MIELDNTQCLYTPDSNTVAGPVNCGVCGKEMLVKRNCYGSTSFVQAMGGVKRLHDSFRCPNSELKWHEQVVLIRIEAARTASTRLRNMLTEEADEIVQENTKLVHETN